MKKYISFAAAFAAIFALTSCTQQDIEPEVPAKGEPVSITAVISSDATKVTLGESDGTATKVVWEADDAFVLTDGTDSYTFAKAEDIENGKAVFTYDGGKGDLPEITSENLSFRYPAVAPESYAEQSGTLEGLSDYITLSADIPEGATAYEGLSVTFSHETSVVRLTLSNEAFKGNEVTGVTLASAEATYTATSTFAGDEADGSIVAYFAVNPGSLTSCVITAVCGEKNYEALLSDNTLSAGRLYKVGKTMEKAPTDLSPLAEGETDKYLTANCYIVTGAGNYRFRATHKGNSNTSDNALAIDHVAVYWETFGTDTAPAVGDLVNDVAYNGGYIRFTASEKKGNALIAAYNSSDVIIWSWHIWLTDQPEEQIYYNDAGTLMDRNLGATSATPGDVGALGLFYQWGRKDPFFGSSSISNDKQVAKATIDGWEYATSNETKGTIEFATANPTTFIYYNTKNNDWYYTGDSSVDNTRWTTSEAAKSIYDPCPSGWRVPDGGENGVWVKAFDSSDSGTLIFDNNKKGINFSGKFGHYATIWYPATGCLNTIGGRVEYVGTLGNCWSASPDYKEAYLLNFEYYSNKVLYYPTFSYYRSDGESVRCIKE